MKSYRKELWFNAPERMHFTNITSEIKLCLNESNIEEGNQSAKDKSNLIYGKSITDACINWSDTKVCLDQLSEAVVSRNQK